MDEHKLDQIIELLERLNKTSEDIAGKLESIYGLIPDTPTEELGSISTKIDNLTKEIMNMSS